MLFFFWFFFCRAIVLSDLFLCFPFPLFFFLFPLSVLPDTFTSITLVNWSTCTFSDRHIIIIAIANSCIVLSQPSPWWVYGASRHSVGQLEPHPQFGHHPQWDAVTVPDVRGSGFGMDHALVPTLRARRRPQCWGGGAIK